MRRAEVAISTCAMVFECHLELMVAMSTAFTFNWKYKRSMCRQGKPKQEGNWHEHVRRVVVRSGLVSVRP